MVKKMVLPFDTIAGANEALLASAQNDMEFIDGKPTGRIIGSRYEILCFANGFERVTVRVPNAPLAITQEEVDARSIAGDFVFCTFENFIGKLYQNYRNAKKEVRVSAIASAIKIFGDVKKQS